ncbi:beta-glucosidase [Marchantia polymorpha subsp. ruderalis]|uniref:Fibronectin type III-like domain-containing protein n=1 Tax=Marchantia polymorpha TaxID=3197 RepID=A0A2R6XGN5_MARPO|nr:hypothetical protein MARPO_0015s0087 [Marchantia polymorpha]BBN01511.1 hypothetical protein Mp_2g08000 [Marchantia polymorpha subsp. ruderalis]PTQ45281.1 hypothetical protein MARPO_0015s0087 [Marchantia polymorpha]PTQ45282.1 hypothetical protein MARPO_0015s0087 [Marchantia polymorpha]BBN01512.1 hypothetical protein Mp_2g08000 [Marchantia polymorpha subsp. ruderalis]|eukprot:PTQ45280.1 hypothetical protein MARPO_0015s0087 [Marchantia polymorpha]
MEFPNWNFRVLTFFIVLWSAIGGFEVIGLQYACESSPASFSFCNIANSFEERVKDLISELNLSEKIQQLGNTAPGIPRLNIPAYQWWQEALHGVANNNPGVNFDGPIIAATSFPLPILTAASFNSTLFNRIGQVVSTEARAMFNSGQSGLTFWSPNVNIFRDPRWGRGQETPGEDPLLSSIYAANFVVGMQEGNELKAQRNEDPNFKLKTSSCCKHFTAYDLEGWGGVDRDHFDALVTDQDMEDTFNPPFQSCIELAQASSLMCAYTRVNGTPACAHHKLLTKTVREKWDFHGYIVSDCDAVYDMINDPKYALTLEDAVADAVQAGMDLNCGITISNHGRLAVDEGKLSEEEVDRALTNLMLVRMRLGLFDGLSQTQIYRNIGPQDVCTHEHQDLALEAALQGIVLLKNDNTTLPLSRETVSSLAVVGPSAADEEFRMLGSYAGIPCTYITPAQGLSMFVSNIDYQAGCSSIFCEEDDFSDASEAALGADAVVIVVGLSLSEEKEGLDRTSLLLPGHQQELVSSVARASKGPVVLVIMSGGPVDVSFAKDDPNIGSILWVGYPGQAGGQALAEIIFGERNPGGNLPITWYPESFTRVNMTDMHMRPNESSGYPGRTYRFYTEEVVYPFGSGLSYTTFRHTVKSAPAVVVAPNLQQQACYHEHKFVESNLIQCTDHDLNRCEDSSFEIQIEVKNEGLRSGSHVLMLFSTPPGSGRDGVPLRQLIAFERVHLEAESQHTWNLVINACRDLSTVTSSGTKVLGIGKHVLSVGDDKHSIMFVAGSENFLETQATSKNDQVLFSVG